MAALRVTPRMVVGCIALCIGVMPAGAEEGWPSLFRGLVVADSSVGARVVSVEPNSAAADARLRPEDVILQIDGQPIASIDAFAQRSEALRGRRAAADVVILRNGQPQQIRVEIFSRPLRDRWGMLVVPDHDMRFVEASAALEYWGNLARGFREAGNPEDALRAYLNALHHVPDRLDVAVLVSTQLAALVQQRLASGRASEALPLLEQHLSLLGRLFEQPLSVEQLRFVKTQLVETVQSVTRLRKFSSPTP